MSALSRPLLEDVEDGEGGTREGRWCPEEQAGLASRLFFGWATSLMRLGNRKALEAEDLWDVSRGDEAQHVAERFDRAQLAELSREKPSLRMALLRANGAYFMAAGLLKLVHDLFQFSSPVLIREMLEYLKQAEEPVSYGLGLALLLLACNILQSLCIHTYFQMVYRVGIHVRTAVISTVYRKALHLSPSAKQSTSTGEIVNLQSNDAQKLGDLCVYLHVIWSGPLQIFGALGLLFYVIGVIPALAGLATMMLLLPFNGVMMHYQTKVRKRLVECTDKRIKLITEVINGMKAIKLYAWEQPFRNRVESLRDAEVKELTTTILLDAFDNFFYGLNPTLVALASFFTFVLLGGELDAAVAFPALALFNMLRFPLSMVPSQVNSFIQATVSVGRLSAFLNMAETSAVVSAKDEPLGTINIADASFSWAPGDATTEDVPAAATLCGINLRVEPGQLLMVVGEVGSGKSSLLAAILGEIHQTSGQVSVSGNLAYTAQDPWIQNATLKDNILMGRPFVQSTYDQVLSACALYEDLKALPGGDEAEIGEKGINLSGGQKHRVALARAAYTSADIYLFDDPLSAVDSHVGRHLFNECICRLLRGRTRVLVTHQLQYAASADAIAIVKQGRIMDYGSFADLQARGVDLSPFGEGKKEQEVNTTSSLSSVDTCPADSTSPTLLDGCIIGGSGHSIDQDDDDDDNDDVPAYVTAGVEQNNGVPQVPVRLLDGSQGEEEGDVVKAGGREPENENGVENSADAEVASKALPNSTLVKEEQRSVGKVSRGVYMAYVRGWGGGSLVMPAAVFAAFVLAETARVTSDTWLAVWTDAIRRGTASTSLYLGVYGGTALLSSLLMWWRWLMLAKSTITSAKTMHAQLLERILRLPMSFFDSQPSGRLLNRFTRDTEQIDLELPMTLGSYLSCAFKVVFSLGIVVFVLPSLALLCVPVLAIYYHVQRFYINTSRELKRLDSIARSPIFGHFGESIQGLSTIRAFRMQRAFVEKNNSLLDRSTAAFYANVVANRWLGIRLEMLGASFVFSTAALAVSIHTSNAGFAGLALMSVTSITSYMNWFVRMNAEMETQMNSVERILEYSQLPTEAAPVLQHSRPPTAWPQHGAIEARNVYVRYRADLEPVLKGVSFKVNGGEKIGICGRTGCGKSTLMLALYRLMELHSGSILIDGLDISSIGLLDLRSRLALVPQDPVVFSGSVRMNLDPFEEASSDSQLWEALRQAGMASFVSALPGKLDAEVSEGGSNLSTGQRQLLCMARALLRKAQILVLDEATSNVDTLTDAIIQRTVREAFASLTVLTIAHRLHTIVDADRILLLDAGVVAEFDTPATLAANPRSRFSAFLNQNANNLSPAPHPISSSLH